jgi:hypothetical protein
VLYFHMYEAPRRSPEGPHKPDLKRKHHWTTSHTKIASYAHSQVQRYLVTPSWTPTPKMSPSLPSSQGFLVPKPASAGSGPVSTQGLLAGRNLQIEQGRPAAPFEFDTLAQNQDLWKRARAPPDHRSTGRPRRYTREFADIRGKNKNVKMAKN